ASLDNEADHLLAWAHGGTTGISNLAQPCPKHHRLRHTGGWEPGPATKDHPPGWISPTGRHYASEQPDWEPPWLPEVVRQMLQGQPNGLERREHKPPQVDRQKQSRPGKDRTATEGPAPSEYEESLPDPEQLDELSWNGSKSGVGLTSP
ncbi:HNH endonuclease signature motif containing protein, partial [Arthrobacter sp. HMWF013]|uniref:HNH endonuclease signature motif containing protein n=1 Tax=Arthrobacter sp. HMWF013 TaxID=2056849 RepID=UPI002159F8F1